MAGSDNAQEMESANRMQDGGGGGWLSKFKLGCLRAVLRWCAPEVLGEIYPAVMQRPPDAVGFAAYRQELQRHGDLGTILKSFLVSDEYRKKAFVARAPELIKGVYQSVLGRDPDDAGLKVYTTLLAEKQDVTPFVSELVGSAEFKERAFQELVPGLVKSAFRGVLGREADDANLTEHTRGLIEKRDLAPVLDQLVQSPEFQDIYNRRTAHPELVDAVYRGLLGREPDPEGRETYLAMLNGAGTKSGFISDVAGAEEARARVFQRLAPDVVQAAYQGIIGRDANDAEVKEAMQGLVTPAQLIAVFDKLVNAPEFDTLYRTHKQAPELIDAAYRGLLGREPDEETVAQQTAALTRSGDLAAFLASLLKSAEFEKTLFVRLAPDFVKSAYEGIFGRMAKDADIAAHVTKLTSAQGWTLFLNALIESQEFARRHDMAEEGLDQPLTPPLVRMGFLFILGRTTAEKDVNGHLQLKTAGALRLALIRSAEFGHHWNNLIATPRPAYGETTITKTVLLHIPKTGGTTMHEALVPFFDRKQICPERFNGLHRFPSGALASYRYFSGHFTLESCSLIPGPKRVITMLRHPIDRLVSFYNFSRAHADDVVKQRGLWLASLARKYSLPDLFALEEVRNHPSVNNAMVRVLASTLTTDRWEAAAKIDPDTDPSMSLLPLAKENLRALLAFGIMERYDESAEMIFHALGFALPAKIKPKMVLKDIAGTAVGLEKLEVQRCEPETLDVLMPLADADLALYEYAQGLFAERLQAFRAGQSASDATHADSASPSTDEKSEEHGHAENNHSA